MTYRQYLFWMIFVTGLTWFGLASVLRHVDPMTSGIAGPVFFYLMLGFALIGTLTVIGLTVRARLRAHEAVARHAMTSFRQAVLLSILATGTLALHGRSLLNPWTLTLFISVAVVAEFFLISFRMDKR